MRIWKWLVDALGKKDAPIKPNTPDTVQEGSKKFAYREPSKNSPTSAAAGLAHLRGED